MSPIQWLVVFIVLLVIEIITLGLTTIWFAGGALLALIISAAGGSLPLQMAAFIVVSLVLVIFTRPVAARHFNHDRTRTNVDDMIGKHAVVTEPINNLRGEGKVMAGGMEWTARSSEENVTIEKDVTVEVLEVRGVKLICRELS